MKAFHNIFTNSKLRKQNLCPNSNIPITIDTREKQSLIYSCLLNKKANVKFEKLEIGDYLIGDTIIERKTFSDFINSMINKRLQEQLINLKKYQRHFLVLESFDYDYEKYKVHKNAIRGMILSIATDFQIPLIYTKDEEDTANFLILLAKKYESLKLSNQSLRQSKIHKTREEQKQFILEGFPGIGPVISKSLLEKHKTLKNIFNLKEEELRQIPKFDKNKVKKFRELLEK